MYTEQTMTVHTMKSRCAWCCQG